MSLLRRVRRLTEPEPDAVRVEVRRAGRAQVVEFLRPDKIAALASDAGVVGAMVRASACGARSPDGFLRCALAHGTEVNPLHGAEIEGVGWRWWRADWEPGGP